MDNGFCFLLVFSLFMLFHCSQTQWVTRASLRKRMQIRCSWKWFVPREPTQMILRSMSSVATTPAVSPGLELSILTRSALHDTSAWKWGLNWREHIVFLKCIMFIYEESDFWILSSFGYLRIFITISLYLGHLWVSNVWTARVSLLLHRVCQSVSQRTRLQVSPCFLFNFVKISATPAITLWEVGLIMCLTIWLQCDL